MQYKALVKITWTTNPDDRSTYHDIPEGEIFSDEGIPEYVIESMKRNNQIEEWRG